MGIFGKLFEIQFSLKYDKHNVHYTWTHTLFDNISLKAPWNEESCREISKENQSTHFMFKEFFFVFRKLCFYRACQAIVDSMTHGIVWLTPKASDIRSNYVVVMFSTAKLVARTQIYFMRTLWVLFILKDVREISRMHQW